LAEKNLKPTLLDHRMLGNAQVKFEPHRYQQHLLALQKQMDVVVEAVINKEFFVIWAAKQ
jgi:hypothetical protein